MWAEVPARGEGQAMWDGWGRLRDEQQLQRQDWLLPFIPLAALSVSPGEEMARTLQARGPDGTKLLYKISRLKFMTAVGIIIHCQDPHSGPRLQDVGCSQFTDIPSVTGNCDALPVESSQAQTSPLYTQHLTDGGQEKLGSSLFISFQFQHEMTPPVTKASVATLRNIVFSFFFLHSPRLHPLQGTSL